MNRPANNYTVVALMYDDEESRCYEVVRDEDGAFWTRDTRIGKPWHRVAFVVHADIAGYLAGCEANFGWRIVHK